MANTTNYNWETPDDTDLVKDGAAAIRTLGSSVDTTTKALNPSTTLGDIEYRSSTANTNTRLPIGTTGQILSVVAGVPAWVANDVGDITEVAAGTGISVASGTGPIPTVSINTAVTADLTTAQTLTNKTLTSPVLTTPSLSTIDAKGDLIVGTADNTIGRLAVGTNDYVLVAASGETTGLKWAAPVAGGMTLINTSSMSAVASLSMNSIFSATYSRYRIVIYTTQSVADWINLRLRVSGSDNTTSNYFGSNIRRTGGSNTGTDAVATTGWSKFFFAGQKLSTISFDIMNPFSSSLNTVTTSTFGAQETVNAEVVTGTSYGLFNADTSFDGLSLISTGTMTGEVKVYGYPE